MAKSSSPLHRLKDRLGSKDPYWDGFIKRAPTDPKNILASGIVRAEEGNVYPSRTEVHDPAAMSGHIKELAKFFGADLVGIAALSGSTNRLAAADTGSAVDEGSRQYPYAIACVVATDYDVEKAKGIGGQLPLQTSAVVNFNVSAYIRELGFSATLREDEPYRVAAAAGLGELDRSGRLVTRRYGGHVAIAGVVLTDLPLAPDTAEAAR